MTKSFEDFGANGNNSGDDSSAIKTALQSGEMIRNPTDSVYRITNTVSVLTDENIDWEGGEIKFNGSTNEGAVDIRMKTDADGKQTNIRQSINIDNCAIRASFQSDEFGLRIRPQYEPSSSTKLIRQKAPTRLGDGLAVGPRTPWETSGGYFLKGIILESLTNVSVGAVSVKALKVAGADYISGSIGILITGKGQPTLMDFFGVQLQNLEFGVKIDNLPDGVEGVSFRGGSIIQVKYGIVANYGEAGNDPGFWCTGMHINASRICIKVSNAYDISISENELYHSKSHDTVASWVGVELWHSAKFHIGRNIFNGGADDNSGIGRAIKLGGTTPPPESLVLSSKQGVVFDNVGYNLDAGILPTGLSLGVNDRIYVRDNVFRNQSDTLLAQTTATPANLMVAWSF